MHNRILITNARLVNEGRSWLGGLLIEGDKIAKIYYQNVDTASVADCKIVDAQQQWLLPGVIDDQVHFREPGLTHKADIATESRAAVAGGITSYMEMPNTQPQTVTQQELQNKYDVAATKSLANYSFFMGATNDNLDEVLQTNPKNVCGIKIFMGSSTGNMLVDNETVLKNIFAQSPMLIAVHCEYEPIVRANTDLYKQQYPTDDAPTSVHPLIRSHEACYRSSSFAVQLAKQHDTRLHILHISTAIETQLFDNALPSSQKRITAEACIHHLWFADTDYERKGNFIKWNPAVKTAADRQAIWEAVLDNRIDVIATDHAPHTIAEKQQSYFKAPSGGPLVQHALPAMLQFWKQNKISIERVVEKMCHTPADIFKLHQRGYLREGYFADLVLVDSNAPWQVTPENILYKCGWSPFEGEVFDAKITHTFVSGHLAYCNGVFDNSRMGQRLTFDR